MLCSSILFLLVVAIMSEVILIHDESTLDHNYYPSFLSLLPPLPPLSLPLHLSRLNYGSRLCSLLQRVGGVPVQTRVLKSTYTIVSLLPFPNYTILDLIAEGESCKGRLMVRSVIAQSK